MLNSRDTGEESLRCGGLASRQKIEPLFRFAVSSRPSGRRLIRPANSTRYKIYAFCQRISIPSLPSLVAGLRYVQSSYNYFIIRPPIRALRRFFVSGCPTELLRRAICEARMRLLRFYAIFLFFSLPSKISSEQWRPRLIAAWPRVAAQAKEMRTTNSKFRSPKDAIYCRYTLI